MLILGILGGPIALAVALIFKYWRQIKTGFTDAAKFCENVAKAGFNAVRNVIGLELRGAEVIVRAFIAGVKATLSWFNGLGNLFRGWWNRAVSAVESAASRMLSFVRSIPGRIRSALGNLGGLLFSAGKAIIQGLINGIKSMVGAAGSAVSGIVSEIKNFLPFSPAKKGPLAGSGNPRNSGLSIARQLAQGIIAGHGLVTAAARQLTTGVSLSAAAGIQQGTLRTLPPAAAGGGGGGGSITVMVDGRKLFEIYQSQLYRYNIRNSGTVTGVVKPV
jgi:phage-related protein